MCTLCVGRGGSVYSGTFVHTYIRMYSDVSLITESMADGTQQWWQIEEH